MHVTCMFGKIHALIGGYCVIPKPARNMHFIYSRVSSRHEGNEPVDTEVLAQVKLSF